jgi:hypothetical protein
LDLSESGHSNMLTQIYEVSTPEEATSISRIGVDHIGVLVGKGEFPRELPVEAAAIVAAAVHPPPKLSALFLTADLSLIEKWARQLRPAIVHLGAAPELLSPDGQAARHAPDEKHPGGGRGEHRDCPQLRRHRRFSAPGQPSRIRPPDRRARRNPRLEHQPSHRRACPDASYSGRGPWAG